MPHFLCSTLPSPPSKLTLTLNLLVHTEQIPSPLSFPAPAPHSRACGAADTAAGSRRVLPDLFLREKKVGFYPAGEFEEFTLQSWCHPQLAAATLSCLLPLLPEKAFPCGSWLDCRDSLGSEISGVLHFAETPLGRDQTIPEENSGREVDAGDLLHHLFPTPPSLFLALLQDSSHRGYF